MKKCSCCSRPALYSVVVVVSSVGCSPRVQKCSPAVLFCDGCLRGLCNDEHCSVTGLRGAVNSAYTALHLLSCKHSQVSDSTNE